MKTTRYITKKVCKTCGTKTSALCTYDLGGNIAADSPVYYHPQTGSIVLNCKGCGEPKWAWPVKGVVSTKHECNAKCLSSTGFACECSCGGKNHGASHAS
jgi:hypothetical protein